jgi:hypothetical protein
MASDSDSSHLPTTKLQDDSDISDRTDDTKAATSQEATHPLTDGFHRPWRAWLEHRDTTSRYPPAVPVAFFFEDATGGQPREYSLRIIAQDAAAEHEVTVLHSDKLNAPQRRANVVPPGELPLKAFFEVRHELTGEVIVSGPLAFPRDPSRRGWVDMTFPDGQPSQLVVREVGRPRVFLVTLVDDAPTAGVPVWVGEAGRGVVLKRFSCF